MDNWSTMTVECTPVYTHAWYAVHNYKIILSEFLHKYSHEATLRQCVGLLHYRFHKGAV